jgi:predicted RNase H-like HicB family nuclease
MELLMTLQITTRVRGAIRKDEQTGVFVSFCPTLKIYSQGTDEERAKSALESAVKLFLTTCIQRGQLDQALQQHGFSEVTKAEAQSPKHLAGEYIAIEQYDDQFEFDVPVYLLNQEEKASLPC